MKNGLALVFVLLLAGGALHAQVPRPADTNTAVEITGGNHALQLRYLAPSPWEATGRGRSDLDYGFLLSERPDIIASTALMFHTNLDMVPRLTINVGPQGYMAFLSGQHKTDVFAIAFGASARYVILPQWGIAAFGSAFYSPGVLTFGSAHNVYDFTAGAEIQFESKLTGIAGYRWLKFTAIDESDLRVQNELFVGLRWRLK